MIPPTAWWVTGNPPGRLFTANEMRLAETVTVDLAMAIESARLVRHA